MSSEFIKRALNVYKSNGLGSDPEEEVLGLRDYRKALIKQLNLRVDFRNINKNGDLYERKISKNGSGNCDLPKDVKVFQVIRLSERFSTHPPDPIVVHVGKRKMKRKTQPKSEENPECAEGKPRQQRKIQRLQ